jgi:hypothetical protein
LRGRIVRRSGSAVRARDALVASASEWEHAEPATAAQMLADAVLPALRAGEPSEAVRIARRAAQLAGDRDGQVALSAMVALGTALIFAGEYAEGASLIDTATEDAGLAVDAQLRASLGAGLVLAGRDAQAHKVLTSLIDEARTAGALSVLPYSLLRLGDVQLQTGAWSEAASMLYEAAQLAEQPDRRPIAAWRAGVARRRSGPGRGMPSPRRGGARARWAVRRRLTPRPRGHGARAASSGPWASRVGDRRA